MTVARRGKRIVDVLGALGLLVAAVPLLAVCVVLVRVHSRGPVFYRQWRGGSDGRPFLIWKVRTMEADAERRLAVHLRESPAAAREWEEFGRLARDPRLVPRVGRWLRRTSLDELPQLWNVLRGEMSLVGPRPLELVTVGELRAGPHSVRASVRPGLTGLWQVSGRSELTLAQMVALDEVYVRTWSLWLDARILARTPLAALSARGAY